MKLAVQIAAGIVMAAAITGVARHLYIQAQLKVAAEAIQQMQVDMQRRSAERTAARQQAQQAKEQAAAAQMRLEAAAAKAEQEAERRKAAAWEAFYVPTAKCLAPPNWDVQIECGNAHIRAKREFEGRWSRGEL
jgi:hypothetical protein